MAVPPYLITNPPSLYHPDGFEPPVQQSQEALPTDDGNTEQMPPPGHLRVTDANVCVLRVPESVAEAWRHAPPGATVGVATGERIVLPRKDLNLAVSALRLDPARREIGARVALSGGHLVPVSDTRVYRPDLKAAGAKQWLTKRFAQPGTTGPRLLSASETGELQKALRGHAGAREEKHLFRYLQSADKQEGHEGSSPAPPRSVADIQEHLFRLFEKHAGRVPLKTITNTLGGSVSQVRRVLESIAEPISSEKSGRRLVYQLRPQYRRYSE